MGTRPRSFLRALALIVGVLLGAGILYSAVRGFRTSRCVDQGVALVEGRLRAGGTGVPLEWGAFVGLEGRSSHQDAVWNIQGYDYKYVRREAVFARHRAPIVIYVTEGRLTNPGASGPQVRDMGDPRSNDWRVYVSHPGIGR